MGVRAFMIEAADATRAVRESRPDGQPLLLLHGGPGMPDGMQTAIAPLLPELRSSFDQRGTGGSSCRDGRYNIAAYLADIEAVRQALAMSSWHVLGHSWGGLLAQACTARHRDRVRSLVLSGSSLGLGDDWKQTKREASRTHTPARRGVGNNALLRLWVGPGGARAGRRLGDAPPCDRDLA